MLKLDRAPSKKFDWNSYVESPRDQILDEIENNDKFPSNTNENCTFKIFQPINKSMIKPSKSQELSKKHF